MNKRFNFHRVKARALSAPLNTRADYLATKLSLLGWRVSEIADTWFLTRKQMSGCLCGTRIEVISRKSEN